MSFDFGASYVYAQDLLDNEPIILIPPFNSYQRLKYTPRKENWSFEITNQTYFKQTRFPDSNFIFDYIEDGSIVSKTLDLIISTTLASIRTSPRNNKIMF